MKIVKLEAYTAEPALKQPTKIAYGVMRSQPMVLLRILSDDGLQGWGEVPAGGTLNYGGYTQDAMIRNVKENFENKLLGRDPTNVEPLIASLDEPVSRSQEEREVNVKAALDMAIHDLAGKIAGVPVWKLIGGAFRNRIQFSRTIGIDEPRRAAETAAGLVRRGVRSLKVKVGLNLEEDAARLKEIRKAVGDSVCLWIDANEQWSVRRTIEAVRKMASTNVAYVEQPTPGGDVEALAQVRRALFPDVKVIADQSIYSIRDAKKVLRASAADVISVKPVRMGLLRSKQSAFLAEMESVDCKIGYGGELGLGSAASLHLAGAIRNLDPNVSELSLGRVTDVLADGIDPAPKNNTWALPMKLGLGVKVRIERFRRFS